MAAESGWLTRLLTPAKQDSSMWTELADALETIFNSYPETYLDRLKSRISLFEMGEDDLWTRLLELGDYYTTQEVTESNLPLVIMQKEDEIHWKRTVYPLVNTLNREFSGLGVTWEPLYAPIDQDTYPYGDLLVIEDELEDYESQGLERDGWFLTSRGVIRIPMNKISTDYDSIDDDALADFEEELKRVVYPLLPLRIVCDGQQYFISVDFAEAVIAIAMTDTITDTYPMMTEETISISEFISDETVTSIYQEESGRGEWTDTASIRMDGYACDSIKLDR